MTNLKKITIEEIIENNYPEIVYENQYGTEVAVIKFDEDKLAEEIKQLISETIGGDMPVKDKSHTTPCHCSYDREGKRFGLCKRCVDYGWSEQNRKLKKLRHAFDLKGEYEK